jgi:hypothetical protein
MHETPQSPDPESTDSAQTRARGPARRIPLNLVYDYPVRWSKYKVLRDLIQNFFDSIPRVEWNSRFGHRLVGERLILTSQGVDFSYDWLIPIGASTKRDGDGLYAGYFGEGFKIAALCAVRDHGWQIEVRSRDWRLAVVPDTLKVDGRDLRSLAYDIAHCPHHSADTELTIEPFCDSDILDAALLSFFFPANPLLGAEIWSGPSGAVYFRSQRPKPYYFPATYDSRGAGIVFAGFQALGSFAHPLVFCLHNYRSSDRERNDFYMMDVVKTILRVVADLPPAAAAVILEALKGRWYEHPRKKYDFDSWCGIIRTLAHRVAVCPDERARWRERFPDLLVAAPVKRSELPRYNRRRQALAWTRIAPRRYRLVQDGFLALGYPTLESVCEAYDGFAVPRAPAGAEPGRIAILESLAKTLLGDLIEQVGLPPCRVIGNAFAAWQGMTTCVALHGARDSWRGMTLRYRLPYVAVDETLVRPGQLGPALSTYLHELAHMFGGDSSVAFGHALSEMLSRAILHAGEIAARERQWDAPDAAPTAADPRCDDPAGAFDSDRRR